MQKSMFLTFGMKRWLHRKAKIIHDHVLCFMKENCAIMAKIIMWWGGVCESE